MNVQNDVVCTFVSTESRVSSVLRTVVTVKRRCSRARCRLGRERRCELLCERVITDDVYEDVLIYYVWRWELAFLKALSPVLTKSLTKVATESQA